ncbi:MULTISPECIES: PD40 domain-containing protein [Thermoanaerobacterium]|jgi:Tol biopolymer transport system component|nr:MULTISPECIES: PD40 domain-containing protein [Thermoanaerobacterium]TCW34109.1 WD40 repeat protein [Thermohydrogenium kirishiense]KAA5806225.1 hypothetical protein F1655_10450 [Thermoanaerobacterium thermosaccharolyticum]MBE0067669.1 hypothetical protein [Thermoanaerobacterium thermosaccharolyticum]MBE0227252.1 hypothetical protein [Thermoanaerobacterium thermosaccharolyticum]WKV07744.1 PD40 domain-containing protein [Thermoanaerobacterium sp. CMT5567-10]
MSAGEQLKNNHGKKFTSLVIIIIVVFISFIICLFNYSYKNQYNGWLTGLIPDKKGSDLIVVNPISHDVKKILTLPDIAPDQFGAVSPNGKYAAYTQVDQKKGITYINIMDLNKKNYIKKYLDDVYGMQAVFYLSWFPDNQNLLLVRMTRNKDLNSNQEICILNIKNNKLKHLVSGGEWDGVGLTDDNKIKYYMSQEELNKLIMKYGGPKTIPIEKVGTKLFVRFSSPSISPDGSKIVYSATLYRNQADEGDPIRLWLASSIWMIDLKDDSLKRIYSDQEVSNGSAIGHVTWSSDGKRLVFYRYRGSNGSNGRLDCLDLKSIKVKTIVPVTEENYTNISPHSLPNNNISFISVSKQGSPENAKQYIVNLKTGSIKDNEIKFNKRSIIMWNFTDLH